ncbi:unnamed protein product [Brassica rapa subsp. trilocularis]
MAGKVYMVMALVLMACVLQACDAHDRKPTPNPKFECFGKCSIGCGKQNKPCFQDCLTKCGLPQRARDFQRLTAPSSTV